MLPYKYSNIYLDLHYYLAKIYRCSTIIGLDYHRRINFFNIYLTISQQQLSKLKIDLVVPLFNSITLLPSLP